MLNNFIYTDKKSLFELELESGNILDESIVFIKDTQQIWNHGVYFNCADPVATPLVTELKEGLMSPADKIKLNNTNIAYGTCGTYKSTSEKVVTLNTSHWELKTGSIVIIYFHETNTASNPKFNVNNTGAKPVVCGSSTITTSNLHYAGQIYRTAMYVYNGSEYVFMGWSYDNDTTYSGMTEEEATSGTSTTNRLISAKILHNKINAVVSEATAGLADIPQVDQTETTCTIQPNVFNIWGEVASLDITLGEEQEGIVNEFLFQFTSGETPTTLILPDTIKWVNDAPEIEANMTYQCSIINNIGVICGAL